MIVLGVLVVVLGGVAAWLWVGKSAALLKAREYARQLDETTSRLNEFEAHVQQERQRADTLQRRIDELLPEVSRAQSIQEKLQAEIASIKRETRTQLDAQAHQHQTELAKASELHAQQVEQLEAERARFEKQARELKEQLTETFERLSGKVLQDAQKKLLEQAKEQFVLQHKADQAELDKRKAAVEQLVKPIDETLKATRAKLDEIEKARTEHYAQLTQRMESLSSAGTELREETAKLAKALSKPEIRGQYGEIQLRRVAELAGMTKYCDFAEQSSTRDSEGKALRPDMVVQLPNERRIAVDAKANIQAYLDAIDAENDDERQQHLHRFARHIKDQIKQLGQKSYWSLLDHSPEFVVMFVPGDQYVDAALAQNPDLIDYAAQNNVILASPSTLIGLLRAVAVGWREQALTEQADELINLGQQLHERAAIVFKYTADLGKSITQCVNHFNKLTRSIDSRMRPTLVRFEETNVKSGKTLVETPQVSVITNTLQALPAAANDSKNDSLQ